MVGSLDSNKMIFGIKESNSFPVRISYSLASLARYVEVGMFWILVFSHCFFFDQRFLPTDLIGGPLGAAFFDNSILFLLGTVESDWWKKKKEVISFEKRLQKSHPETKRCFYFAIHPSIIRQSKCFVSLSLTTSIHGFFLKEKPLLNKVHQTKPAPSR